MGWRIVLQPNGRLARFSDVVDDFTHMDMTRDEALFTCALYMSPDEARAKVERGEKDEPDGPRDGHPFQRWRDSIATVRAIHGFIKAERRIETGERAADATRSEEDA
jgi:hypothetical protein